MIEEESVEPEEDQVAEESTSEDQADDQVAEEPPAPKKKKAAAKQAEPAASQGEAPSSLTELVNSLSSQEIQNAAGMIKSFTSQLEKSSPEALVGAIAAGFDRIIRSKA